MTAWMERSYLDDPPRPLPPAPRPKPGPAVLLAERCPECGTGHVVHLSDNPTDVRHRCSRRCGWDA